MAAVYRFVRMQFIFWNSFLFSCSVSRRCFLRHAAYSCRFLMALKYPALTLKMYPKIVCFLLIILPPEQVVIQVLQEVSRTFCVDAAAGYVIIADFCCLLYACSIQGFSPIREPPACPDKDKAKNPRLLQYHQLRTPFCGYRG